MRNRPGVRAEQIAKPSIAERGAAGYNASEAIDWARTRPNASASAIVSARGARSRACEKYNSSRALGREQRAGVKAGGL